MEVAIAESCAASSRSIEEGSGSCSTTGWFAVLAVKLARSSGGRSYTGKISEMDQRRYGASESYHREAFSGAPPFESCRP